MKQASRGSTVPASHQASPAVRASSARPGSGRNARRKRAPRRPPEQPRPEQEGDGEAGGAQHPDQVEQLPAEARGEVRLRRIEDTEQTGDGRRRPDAKHRQALPVRDSIAHSWGLDRS